MDKPVNQADQIRILRMKLGCGLKEAYDLIVKHGTAEVALAALNPRAPTDGSDEKMKAWLNTRAVLDLNQLMKDMDAVKFSQLPGSNGIIPRLVRMCCYQQQQIEALYRTLKVVIDREQALYDNPAIQHALKLQAAEGEFPDTEDEDEPDDEGKED